MRRALIAIAVAAALLLGTNLLVSGLAERNAELAREELMRSLLPGSGEFAEVEAAGADEAIDRVFQAENGHVIQTTTNGYAGGVVLLTGVDSGGRVTGVSIRQMEETKGVGSRVLRDEGFLSQFIGSRGDIEADAVSGATVTSKAVARGVNAAAGYVTGADTSSGATQWGG